MSFDWAEYLKVASYLHDNLFTEASYRSGVSRSYYSVFGKTKLFCIYKGFLSNAESKSPQSHSLIPKRLYEQDDTDLYEIAQRYEALKARRILADYDPFSRDFSKVFLQDTINKSNQLLILIKSY